jgi:hypothetical protein
VEWPQLPARLDALRGTPGALAAAAGTDLTLREAFAANPSPDETDETVTAP